MGDLHRFERREDPPQPPLPRGENTIKFPLTKGGEYHQSPPFQGGFRGIFINLSAVKIPPNPP